MGDIEVLYGDAAYNLGAGRTKIPRNTHDPKYRMPFCHQSAFVKTSLLKRHKFDTRFKIAADSDFFVKIYRAGHKFCYIDEVVSFYDVHGFSSKPNIAFFKEEFAIIAKYNKFYVPILCLKYIIMLAKYCLKSILPARLSLFLQERYNAKN